MSKHVLSTSVICTCAHCGKDIVKTPSAIKQSKNGNNFCNKSCAASFNNVITKAGENNVNWIDGKSSYSKKAFDMYQPKCTICNFNIKSALIVHHIDEDRQNVDIDNLMVLCSNCHCQIHYGDLKITEEIKQSRELLKYKT